METVCNESRCQFSKDFNKELINMFKELKVNMLKNCQQKRTLYKETNYKKQPNLHSRIRHN